ncbi:MAG: hypothetical protein R3Y38_04665 [Rikenellaceae bacterium]
MATSPIIETLKSKIELMLAENKSLREQNKKLTQANDRLKTQAKNLTESLSEANEKLNLLHLSKGFTLTAADNKQAKARVNQLMREVDKCIEMLNGQ